MKAFDALDVPLEGTCLVEASAGTGKTYAISTLFVRHLVENGLDVGQILVVTFTEAATAELRDRIRKRLKEAVAVCEALQSDIDSGARGERSFTSGHDETLLALIRRQGHLGLCRRTLLNALLHFDGAAIYTIHGFCQRVLRENAFSTRAPFDAELVQDVRPLVDELLTDFWLSRLYDAPLEVIRGLQKRNLNPKFRDVVAFANFIASTPLVKLLPKIDAHVLPVRSEQAERAFAAARELFDAPVLSELCSGIYAANHLRGRVEDLATYFSQPYGDVDFPTQRAEWFLPHKLSEASAKKRRELPVHPFLDALLVLAEACRTLEECVEAHILRIKTDLVDYVQRELLERKAGRGLLSFDDLLQQLFNALRSPEGPRLASTLRGRYRAALIDEFQDTDPVQYTIFHSVFGTRSRYESLSNSLFLIGDPKQAIYSFRGADVFAYMHAAAAVPETHRFTMTTNYRSDDYLVRGVNAVFKHHPRPFFYSELEYPLVRAHHSGASILSKEDGQATEGALEVRFVCREPSATKAYAKHELQRLLPARVAEDIRALLGSESTLEGRKLSPKDIAVLTRTNREAFDCQRALASLGIPSVVQGDRSVFEQPEARELQFILAAAAEPARNSTIRTALATELLGLSANDLEGLEADEERWDAWVERFQRYAESWRNEGFIQMIRHLLLECGVTQRLLSSPTGERRMTNVLHLVELLHTQAITEHLGPSGLLQFLSEQRLRSTIAADNEQVRLESDEDAVVLTTIHKSKGLEYPITFCPFLFGSAQPIKPSQWVDFHDQQSRELRVDLGSSDFELHAELKTRESVSENLRLLYVALTRARHRCIIYWGAFNTFHDSAFAYVLYDHALERSELRKVTDEVLLVPLRALALRDMGIQLSLQPPLTSGNSHGRTFAQTNETGLHRTQLEARQISARLQRWLRTASFTELTRHAPTPTAVAPASDHDELTSEEQNVHSSDALEWDTALELEGSAVSDSGAALELDTALGLDTAAEALATPIALAAFPGGATVGNFFHHVLENTDFEQGFEPTQLTRSLVSHGLPVDLAELALAGLVDALRTEFAPGLSLAKIPNASRLNELEFTIPVGSERDSGFLTNSKLAAAFEQSKSYRIPASYAEAVRLLPFASLQGYLKGFIDLVFVHDKRWYLVDYKTNWLGDTYADYTPASLLRSMMSHHYVLQYHLYTLALHRYLSLRIPEFDYARDFGGVYYLFLRGMSPQFTERAGVFFDKPELARLHALDRAFAGSSHHADDESPTDETLTRSALARSQP